MFGPATTNADGEIDRALAVLVQIDQPVAQKIYTGLFYLELSVHGKNVLKYGVLIYSA